MWKVGKVMLVLNKLGLGYTDIKTGIMLETSLMLNNLYIENRLIFKLS